MRNQQSGFTLIELVIVIILLGIIGATVTPQFINIQDNARDAVAEAAVGALNSTALIGFAAGSGTENTIATIIGSTDGVAAAGASSDSAELTTPPVCTVGGSGQLAFTVTHFDGTATTGRTATGSMSDEFCAP